MGKIDNFLSGKRLFEEVESPVNGKLTVISDFAWGTHIQAGGVTQSGGIARKVWESSLREVAKTKKSVDKCLVLGLGAGSIIGVIKTHWPNAQITAVEIDKTMVKLGKKYFDLEKHDVDIKITDAQDFLKKNKDKYDLILVDMYVGTSVPKKFTTVEFIKKLKLTLAKGGIMVANRLYYQEKKAEAEDFYTKLKKVFTKFTLVLPEANIMFICFD